MKNMSYENSLISTPIIVAHIQRGLEYILAVLMIVSCNSVYIWSSEFTINFNELIIWPLAILVLISFIHANLDSILFKQAVYVVIFINIFQIWFVKLRYFNDDLIPYFSKYILFTSLMVIYLANLKIQKRFTIFINRFVIAMAALSLVSTLFWLFGSIMHWIEPTGKVLLYWGGDRDINNYYNLYFETQSESFFGLKIIRNSGIFAEGPMHAVALLSTMIIHLFIQNKNLDWKSSVLAAAIFSSMTTSGVAVLAGIVILKILIRSRARISGVWSSSWKIIVLGMVVTVLGITAYLFLKNKYGTGSYNTRLDDYRAGFKAWKESILFGHEFGNMEPIIQHMSDFRMNNTGYSNSIVLMLVQGGLFYTSFYLLPIFVVLYRAVEHQIRSLVYAMLLFIALFTILIFHETYFAMFLFSIFWIIGLSLSGQLKPSSIRG